MRLIQIFAALLVYSLKSSKVSALFSPDDTVADWEDLPDTPINNGDHETCSIYTCNYGELAQARVYPSMVTLAESLEAMVEDPELFVPGSRWSKDSRKYTEQARDYLDLFCYAYPSGSDKTDMFLELRSVLSVLHHDIGEFNDLPSHKHSEAELDKIKLKTKAGMTKYTSMVAEPRWADYLGHPLIDSFYQRPEADLSRLFWDTVPAELPSSKLTGLENMAGLCLAYINTVSSSWEAIKSWNSKTLKRYYNDVHDVRKEIRALNYTSDFFPEVFRNQEEAQHLKIALRQFYDVYSKVQSHLERYVYYVRKQMRQEALAESQKMQKAWDRLTSWQGALNDNQRLPAILSAMKSNIINIPKTENQSVFPRWARMCFFASIPLLVVFAAVYAYRSVKKDFTHGGGYELIQ